MDMPPTRGHNLMRSCWSTGRMAERWSLIWIASSRVGLMIRALMVVNSFGGSEVESRFRSRSMMGMPKQRVLPWPVLAATTKSTCWFKQWRVWA